MGFMDYCFLTFQMKVRYGILHRNIQMKNLSFQIHSTATQPIILYSIFYLQNKVVFIFSKVHFSFNFMWELLQLLTLKPQVVETQLVVFIPN